MSKIADGRALMEELRAMPVYAAVPHHAFDAPGRATGPSSRDMSVVFHNDPAEAIGQLLAIVKYLDGRLSAFERATNAKDAA